MGGGLEGGGLEGGGEGESMGGSSRARPHPVSSGPGFGTHLEMPTKHPEAGAGKAPLVGGNLGVLWVLGWTGRQL